MNQAIGMIERTVNARKKPVVKAEIILENLREEFEKIRSLKDSKELLDLADKIMKVKKSLIKSGLYRVASPSNNSSKFM